VRKRTIFLTAAGLLGLALAVYLYLTYDIEEILKAFQAVGWGIALIVAWRAVPIILDATGWWTLFKPGRRPPLHTTWWVRWVAESINSLLPVAQIGGDVVRAHLVARPEIVPEPDIRMPEAAATAVVDVTIGIVATTVFSLAGVVLLVTYSTGQAMSSALWGVGGLFVLLGLLLLAQRRGWLGKSVRWMTRKLKGDLGEDVIGGTRDFDEVIAERWRHPGRLARATLWRVASSFSTAGEIWLALWLQGADVTIVDAIVLESLTYAVRTAAFAVPGALGLQEGTLVLLGGLMGVAPDTALAIGLIKRVRELAVGVPGIALWLWLEKRVVTSDEGMVEKVTGRR